MYILTGKDTGLPAYVWANDIVRIEAMKNGGPRPYSRIFLKNEKEHHEFYLDVTETKEEIENKNDS